MLKVEKEKQEEKGVANFVNYVCFHTCISPTSTYFLAQDTGKRYGAKDSMKLDRLNKTEKKHG